MAVIDKRKCYLFQTSDGGNDEISAAARVEFLQPLAVSSSARIANLLAIMSSIVSLHAECRYATLRQLYYANINIAKGQRVIESSVSALTRLLQVPREGLRITSTAKCIIRGPIVIREKHYICSRSVVWHLNQHFNSRVPVFLLTDFDPHGLLVAMTYAFPTRNAKGFSDEAGAFHGVSLVDMPEIPESKRRLLSGLDVLNDLPRMIWQAIEEELGTDSSPICFSPLTGRPSV
ncbi:uncharacterized protein LOC34617876 [Cyclospora cayetanensis]|uniref:Uncharacterized protein LOC34617876 n=1 Tax=Cyclospora cayetanensis TaxID=88456 RepID=A0A6P6RUK5_9EIME|nr:uncharacterized protein LOC34617876 [Cyclospora cayetanensis]